MAHNSEAMSGEATWRGRRVLVTGHTGFKGAWLQVWLEELGADVAGLALAAPTEPSLHALLHGAARSEEIVDVTDASAVLARVRAVEPEVVFHLAAQSLVRRGFEDPGGTFATNVLGTVHLLEAIRTLDTTHAVVIVTSDKVYAPNDGTPHVESSPLGGLDPYSASKSAAEHVVAAYRAAGWGPAGGAGLVAARAGNVIGGGDWAADRVVPDVMSARATGTSVRLRYPDAVRPWQHVLEPVGGYLRYAAALLGAPSAVPPALNFGPPAGSTRTVAELVEGLAARFGGRPAWVRDDAPAPPETATLRLSADLAHESIGWSPRLSFDETLDLTARWYEAYERGDDVRAETVAEIAEYEARG